MKIQKEWAIPVVTGVVGFGVGAIAGYFFKRHRDLSGLEGDIEEIAEDQLQLKIEWNETQRITNKNLQEMNRVFEKMKKQDPTAIESVIFHRFDDPELIQSRENHPAKRGGDWEHIAQVVSEPMTNTTFEGRDVDPNWSYEVELEHRSPDHPYIIHRDEFFSNEMDFEQSTITFYMGDGVLCDEVDVPIPNHEKIVGEIRFGHGSLDPSICYIRNERITHEWEVIVDHGYYQVEVLGVAEQDKLNATDLKHSLQKFRMD